MLEGVGSTFVAQGINIQTSTEQDNNSNTIGFADPNGYFGGNDQLKLNGYTNNAKTNKGPAYYTDSHVVPQEPGGEYSLNLGGLRGRTPHYDQSAYLDGAFVPDPTATNKYDVPPSDGGGHVGSVVLQGPHPLLPPTHYTFQDGQPVPSSGN
jgi:hypothetical protein